METFSALLALCEGNSPVTGEFPSQRPVTRSSDVFFDLRLNKQLCKQSTWRLLQRRCNAFSYLWRQVTQFRESVLPVIHRCVISWWRDPTHVCEITIQWTICRTSRSSEDVCISCIKQLFCWAVKSYRKRVLSSLFSSGIWLECILPYRDIIFAYCYTQIGCPTPHQQVIRNIRLIRNSRNDPSFNNFTIRFQPYNI